MQNTTVFLPKDFDGKRNELVIKVAHSNSNASLYWYCNNEFKGKTQERHELALELKPGAYIITVTDDFGNEIQRTVKIQGK